MTVRRCSMTWSCQSMLATAFRRSRSSIQTRTGRSGELARQSTAIYLRGRGGDCRQQRLDERPLGAACREGTGQCRRPDIDQIGPADAPPATWRESRTVPEPLAITTSRQQVCSLLTYDLLSQLQRRIG